MTSLICCPFVKVKIFYCMAKGILFILCLAVFYGDCPYSLIPWVILLLFLFPSVTLLSSI